MTLTQAQALLDKLEAAYYRGALAIDDAGKHIAFATGEDMRRRISDLKSEIAILGATARPSCVRRAVPARRTV